MLRRGDAKTGGREQKFVKNLRVHLLLTAITISALAPFLHKAFDIDEPLFLWMAQQITKHPFNPYGFEVNWASISQPMWVVMQNPPLCSYYIAAMASVAGWSEVALHTAFLLPAIAAVLGTFAVARRLCATPTMAALLTLFTPVFLISASNIMCDVMLLAFWVWSIEFWLAGLERGKWWLFAMSALLATAATLTKYFGISLIPLLLAYMLVRQGRVTPSIIYLAIPLIASLAYENITKIVYGQGLLSSSMKYLCDVAITVQMPISIKLLTGFSFTGGCMIGALFFAPLRSARWVVGHVALLLAIATLFWIFVPVTGGLGANSMAVRLQGGLFATIGFAILALAIWDCRQDRSAESAMLLLWVIGTFVFATFLNWSITARTILPMGPAVAILLVRQLDRSATVSLTILAKQWPVLCAAALSLVVTYSDYRQANTGREAASHFRKRFSHRNATVWFQSHWGFQWYMQKWGAKPFNKMTAIQPGSFMVVPSNNADPTPIAKESAIPVEEFRLPVTSFVATFAPGTGAGFYSSVRGPVPWVVVRVPPEQWEAVFFR